MRRRLALGWLQVNDEDPSQILLGVLASVVSWSVREELQSLVPHTDWDDHGSDRNIV